MTTDLSASSTTFWMNESERKDNFRNIYYFENEHDQAAINSKVEHLAKKLKPEDNIGISGSQQLSSEQLKILIQKNHCKSFSIIDLREESHCFVNGFPIALVNEENNLNEGKPLEEIKALDASLKGKASISIFECIKEKTISVDGEKKKTISFQLQQRLEKYQIHSIETEEELTQQHRATYHRIPITDHGFPSDEQIDKLTTFFDHQQTDKSWIHFHCAGGKGRTSSAIALFTILRWKDTLSLKDIFSRLETKGNRKMLPKPKPGKKIKERDNPIFWQNFYDFACQRNPGQTWSEWKAKQNS